MTYLRNAWYAAGSSNEFETALAARVIHDQPVACYCGDDGALSALYDACPDRFAPLSLGRIEGDVLACGYHLLSSTAPGAAYASRVLQQVITEQGAGNSRRLQNRPATQQSKKTFFFEENNQKTFVSLLCEQGLRVDMYYCKPRDHLVGSDAV